MLAVPLLHGDEAIGAIQLYWLQVRRLSTADIALLETFADQAVIAIENARLFEELEQRNRETSTEALEQQTATADILRVIAASPMDIQRVLDAIADITRKLCGADAACGAARGRRPSPDAVAGRRYRPAPHAGCPESKPTDEHQS